MPPRKKAHKKSAPAKSKRTNQQLRLLLAALFVIGFLVTSLVLLSQLREKLAGAPVQGPVVQLPTEAEPPLPPSRPPAADTPTVLEDLRVELESALLRSGLAWSDLVRQPAVDGPVSFAVRGEFPPSGILSDLDRRLNRIAPGAHLVSRPEESLLQVVWQDIPRYRLYFHLPTVRPLPSAKRPQVAIVMDDLGRSLSYGGKMLELDLPVSLAILPGEPHAGELAELAYKRGREVLIHLPMEPQGYPLANPGDDALLVDMPADEIDARMRGYLQRVPHAVGGNNHMGSQFTENREGMRVVLGVMKEADLFFLDSLTTHHSVAYAEARQAQVPAAVRDVFLDNDQEVGKITAEIRRLVEVARRRGHAIGICHPYPQTLEALRLTQRELRQAGIDLVPVSRLVVR